jgi:hypothetical protein
MQTNTPMTDEEILQRLRPLSHLPTVPIPEQGGTVQIGDDARGHQCTACGDVIGLADPWPLEYRYADGQALWFHFGRCDQLWERAHGYKLE